MTEEETSGESLNIFFFLTLKTHLMDLSISETIL